MVSLAVSLSLTPTLCARLLGRARPAADVPAWQRIGSVVSDRLRALYLRSLGRTLAHASLALAVLLGAGNAAGGYVVTERMLEMFKSSKKPGDAK